MFNVSNSLAHNPGHFCHPKVYTQDIDSIWQNVTVNKCQAVKNI